MPKTPPRSTPDPTLKTMPRGVPYIIGNEVAERFSFYGMKGILVVFMTQHLINASGEAAYMSDEEAKKYYHLFTAAAYFFPLLGALIADVFWGKYKTILLISLMYCLGHGCLALMDIGPHFGIWDMKPFMFAGLIMIAMGSGGIKPCVSAHVGDQFGSGNKRLLTQVYNWFYFSINLGSTASMMLTPVLLAKVGPWAAFGLPGVLMAIATFVFWLGRDTFIHVPPSGKTFFTETFSRDGRRALLALSPLFLIFIPVFWAMFDQTGSAWVLQLNKMDRKLFGFVWLQSQVQTINPILILVLIPTFTYVLYPAVGKFIAPTPLRKIGVGLFLTAGAFVISAVLEQVILDRSPEVAASLWTALNAAGIQGTGTLDAALVAARGAGWTQTQLHPFLDAMPSIGWQFLAYVIITSAEVLVSIVCLEFAYTQAPPKMKSFLMGIFFLGISLGNLATAMVNWIIEILKRDGGTSPLDGAAYYWFFTAIMFATAVVYVFYAKFLYRGKTFIQGEAPELAHAEAEAEAKGTNAR